ncbi:MAG TPA: type VI secretion system baseplate subunit TssG [Thermoanaerobaculia bacterium]|nr:type VI secretion system baseplate subunit TssG [Thermoanaerobaculia bacterium]
MASYGWRESRSVEAGLFQEGHRFAFLQAVRLLESLYPGKTPPGEGLDPRRELVRFRSKVRLDFPASDVEEVVAAVDGQPAEMTVNILGLAGILGPLPPSVTELILDRNWSGDRALRDFLDLFNHRLVSLLYRARKKYRPALDPNAPDRGRVATVLHSLTGLGTPHLRGRMGVPDRSFLPYAGLLVDRARSTVGMVRLLEDCFGAPVDVTQFQGRWHNLEEPDVTKIGKTGQNQVLGGGAVLGRRVWDQAAGFELRLGPMPFRQFRSFLPDGDAFRPLAAATRFYVREELGFTVRLTVKKEEIPELRLGRKGEARLGWTSWLKTKPFSEDDSQVSLTGGT